jgi:nucleoside 2-deoxyribosyltransferase
MLAEFKVPGSSIRHRVLVICTNENKVIGQNQRVMECAGLLSVARQTGEAESVEIITKNPWSDQARRFAWDSGIRISTYAEKISQFRDSAAYPRDLISKFEEVRRELDLARTAPYVFVLMPFASEFHDIYELGIKSLAVELGFQCERVDEIQFNDSILEQIRAGIQRADVIIADMTGRNPNVFYEVGYAHALQKTVVLLTQDVVDIPFDLKSHNHIVYAGGILILKKLLQGRLMAWLEDRQKRKKAKYWQETLT